MYARSPRLALINDERGNRNKCALLSRQGSGLGAVRRRLRPVVPHALRGPGARGAARRRRVRVRRLRGAEGPCPRRPVGHSAEWAKLCLWTQ